LQPYRHWCVAGGDITGFEEPEEDVVCVVCDRAVEARGECDVSGVAFDAGCCLAYSGLRADMSLSAAQCLGVERLTCLYSTLTAGLAGDLMTAPVTISEIAKQVMLKFSIERVGNIMLLAGGLEIQRRCVFCLTIYLFSAYVLWFLYQALHHVSEAHTMSSVVSIAVLQCSCRRR
jgi:hypothetical protein